MKSTSIGLVMLALAALVLAALPLAAQQTVFNVPSADVLERGKVYLELDATARPVDPVATVTPRLVIGVGRNLEIGVNLGAFSTAAGNVPNFAPTIKWKIHTWEKTGFSLLAGNTLVVPVRETSFTIGNYAYLQMAKQFARTRVVGGVYHFTRGVVATDARVGVQASVEQTLSPRVSLAADWYSGNNSVGYFTPGAILKLSKRVTLYPAYQIGNRGATQGNHQFCFELGWNLN